MASGRDWLDIPMLLWVWLTAEASAPTVGVISFVVTVLAFTVTIWQLWATRREVRRAVREIERFKAKLRSEESIQLVTSLTEQTRQAIDLVRAGRSPPVFDMLDRIRQNVARLASLRKQAGAEFRILEAEARSLSDFMTANERVSGALPEQDRQAAIVALRTLQGDVAATDGLMRDTRA